MAWPTRSSFFPAGALLPATFKTYLTDFYDQVVALLGATGNAAEARAALGVGIRSQLAGLTLSTAGSSTTMSIAAGEAANSTNSQVMQLASSISKTTSAWAVGTAAGGLDTGTIANNTTYHVHLIKRVDTGVVDVVFSLSASAPTLPTNYTLFRCIGRDKTNGSGQWTAFTQDGDYFQLVAPVTNDISANNPGILAVTRTLSVPTGANLLAVLNVVLTNAGAVTPTFSKLTDLATNDVAPTSSFSDTPQAVNAAGGAANACANVVVRTNTSAQIRSRLSVSDANITLTINTIGWIDRRGRDA